MRIRLFCSYSRKDEFLRQELETHLSMLKRQNLVTWYDRLLEPGSDWDDRIKQELDTAEIILLLVSPDFLASNYCYETEVERAIERHKAGTACVIPVLLRPTDIEGLELFKLTGYPKNLKPVTKWRNRDDAFVDVVKGIRQAVNKLLLQASSQSMPTPSVNSTTSLRLHSFAFESVTVNEQGKIIWYQPGEAQQWEEDLGNGVVLETVSIPGGSFLMGSPREEEGRNESESPQHWVEIAPFFMGKYPITQSQYQAVMGNNPSYFQEIVTQSQYQAVMGNNPSYSQENEAARPVEQVSWERAVAFCQKLSRKTKRTYRLPSEAEWEYACRARTTTPFHFGKTITSDLANYDGNYIYQAAQEGKHRKETTSVGKFSPNAFGLFDMHGNVCEWCADHWHPNYQSAPMNENNWITDRDSSNRVVRGGSWNDLPRDCRSAYRGCVTPLADTWVIGLRVVLVTVGT